MVKKIWDSDKDPEKWALMEKNPQLLDKLWEIEPLTEHDCPNFRKRTPDYGKDSFDKTKGESYDVWLREWCFKYGTSKTKT